MELSLQKIEHLKKIQPKQLSNFVEVIPQLGDITVVLDIYDNIKTKGNLYPAFAHRYNAIVDAINSLIDFNNKQHETIREEY